MEIRLKVEPDCIGKKNGILVDASPLKFDELLPQRLAVTDVETFVAERANQPQCHGGLANMLTCSGYVNRFCSQASILRQRFIAT